MLFWNVYIMELTPRKIHFEFHLLFNYLFHIHIIIWTLQIIHFTALYEYIILYECIILYMCTILYEWILLCECAILCMSVLLCINTPLCMTHHSVWVHSFYECTTLYVILACINKVMLILAYVYNILMLIKITYNKKK